MTARRLRLATIAAALAITACGTPGVAGLRDSFAEQVKANRFVSDFQRNGDELLFSAPDGAGRTAKWRIHIDSSTVVPNKDPDRPFKGAVTSSWYANGEAVKPKGRDSNLPVELLDNGISQDCWAFWEKPSNRWSWE
jgi:hypothetical protein